jgi:hypothetical protein
MASTVSRVMSPFTASMSTAQGSRAFPGLSEKSATA